MKRENQELEKIIAALSPIESKWRDAYADQVIATLQALPEKERYTKDDLIALLDSGFKPANTIVQLVLDFSKDEYKTALSGEFGEGGAGSKRYVKDKGKFVDILIQMGVLERLGKLVRTPVTWRSILVERLKGGRGSAIKGQVRGRFLENFAEEIVARVFGESNYSTRCRFTGARGTSTEKADFAIPSKEEARILIEAKAYGATGSKQTDVLGDISRIVAEMMRRSRQYSLARKPERPRRIFSILSFMTPELSWCIRNRTNRFHCGFFAAQAKRKPRHGGHG